MWTRLKTAVLGIIEQLGIEVPELPVDLGPLPPALTDAAAAVVDEAAAVPGAGYVEGLASSR